MATPIPQNTAPFTFEELRRATGGTLFGPAGGEVRGIFSDTREDGHEKAFIALTGEKFDGHHYVGTALARGAKLVIVEHEAVAKRLLAKTDEVSALVVPDTLRALGDIALLHRRRFAIPVLAIAGAAGKTTTRSVSSALYEAILPGRVLSTQGNLNNRVGVPMMALCLGTAHQFAIFELGTNEKGEVAELCRIVEPTLGLVTLIDLEHTEGLGDLDGVEREEGALYEALGASSTVAIGNGGDLRVRRQMARSGASRKILYGFDDDADVRAVGYELKGPGALAVTLDVLGRRLSFETTLLGRPGLLAILAALAATEVTHPGQLTSAIVEDALRGVGEAGRALLLESASGVLVLDDSYNSNPASLRESLRTGRELAELTGGRLFAVIGEMRELGALSESAHRAAAEDVAASGAERVFAVSGDAKFLHLENLARSVVSEFRDDAAGIGRELAPQLRSRDVLVVKASRGVRAERVVAELVDEIGLRPTSARSGAREGTNDGPSKGQR